MMPSDERPHGERRPTSPFLILLLGGAACALGAEWLRFQWGLALAAPPAIAGGVATLSATARAYRARRRWRRRSALVDDAVRGAPPSPVDSAAGDPPIVVRAAKAERPAPWVASRDVQGDARLGIPAADAERPAARRRPAEGHAPLNGARGEDGRDRERERVHAARDDADRRRRRSRPD